MFVSLIDFPFNVYGQKHLTGGWDEEYFCSLGSVTPGSHVPLYGGILPHRHGWDFASESPSEL